MAYLEKHFQSKFTKWWKIQKNLGYFAGSYAIELKLVKAPKKSLSILSFQAQQLPSLQKATTPIGISKKLSDLDPSLKPCDFISMSDANGLVAVQFYKIRQRKPKFIMIEIDDLITAFKKKQDNNQRQTLTEKECKLIGIEYGFDSK